MAIESSFERWTINYEGRDGDSIPAFLLVPRSVREPAPAVVVHHQHNGERRLGKSEETSIVQAKNYHRGRQPPAEDTYRADVHPNTFCKRSHA